MARPRQNTPTQGELEMLKVLWEHGPCTVREAMDKLPRGRDRAYTSVMSMLNVMTDKGLVSREPRGRAFAYSAKRQRDKTLGGMVKDLLGRAFEGSASALVAQVLAQSKPTEEELAEIRRAIEEYERQGER